LRCSSERLIPQSKEGINWKSGELLRIRKLITLSMIIVGIVLVISGVFAATYHYKSYYDISLIGGYVPQAHFPYTYVYPYTVVGLILCTLGLVMLIIGPLLLLVKLDDRIL
jgi:hypothetical protein